MVNNIRGACVMSTKIDNTVFLVSNLKNLLQDKLWLLEERLQQIRLNSPYKYLTNAEARVFATLRGEALTISILFAGPQTYRLLAK